MEGAEVGCPERAHLGSIWRRARVGLGRLPCLHGLRPRLFIVKRLRYKLWIRLDFDSVDDEDNDTLRVLVDDMRTLQFCP